MSFVYNYPLRRSPRHWYADPYVDGYPIPGMTTYKGFVIKVSNLNYYTIPNTLRDAARQYGALVECYLIYDGIPNINRGFGFLKYFTQDAAFECTINLDGRSLDGRNLSFIVLDPNVQERLRVERGRLTVESPEQPATTSLPITSVKINGIINSITETMLKEKFSRYGNVADIYIPRFSGGMVKGYGFVRYYNSNEACKAVEEMNGTVLNSVRIEVHIAMKSKKVMNLELEKTQDKREDYSRMMEESSTDDDTSDSESLVTVSSLSNFNSESSSDSDSGKNAVVHSKRSSASSKHNLVHYSMES